MVWPNLVWPNLDLAKLGLAKLVQEYAQQLSDLQRPRHFFQRTASGPDDFDMTDASPLSP